MATVAVVDRAGGCQRLAGAGVLGVIALDKVGGVTAYHRARDRRGRRGAGGAVIALGVRGRRHGDGLGRDDLRDVTAGPAVAAQETAAWRIRRLDDVPRRDVERLGAGHECPYRSIACRGAKRAVAQVFAGRHIEEIDAPLRGAVVPEVAETVAVNVTAVPYATEPCDEAMVVVVGVFAVVALITPVVSATKVTE